MTTQTQMTTALKNGQAYITEASTYRLDEVKNRLGLSDVWIRKARRAGLRISVVSGRGIEVVSGRDIAEFLEKHPNLLTEDI